MKIISVRRLDENRLEVEWCDSTRAIIPTKFPTRDTDKFTVSGCFIGVNGQTVAVATYPRDCAC